MAMRKVEKYQFIKKTFCERQIHKNLIKKKYTEPEYTFDSKGKNKINSKPCFWQYSAILFREL